MGNIILTIFFVEALIFKTLYNMVPFMYLIAGNLSGLLDILWQDMSVIILLNNVIFRSLPRHPSKKVVEVPVAQQDRAQVS
jgi:hypothetical protein